MQARDVARGEEVLPLAVDEANLALARRVQDRAAAQCVARAVVGDERDAGEHVGRGVAAAEREGALPTSATASAASALSALTTLSPRRRAKKHDATIISASIQCPGSAWIFASSLCSTIVASAMWMTPSASLGAARARAG